MTQEPDVAPIVTVAEPTVTVTEGETATNSGTAYDPNGESVTLSATAGTVTKTDSGWTWEYATDNPGDTQGVQIVAEDHDGRRGQMSFFLRVRNSRPVLEVDQETVTASPGETATNSGSLSVRGPDAIASLTASFGTVSRTGSSWTWTGTTPESFDGGRTVVLTARDEDGGVDQASFELRLPELRAPPEAGAVTTVDDFASATEGLDDGDFELPATQRRRINDALARINPDLYGTDLDDR